MTYPRFQMARAFKYIFRTAGSYSYAAATWGSMAGGSSLDFVLAAQVGDVIEYSVNLVWGTEAIYGSLDVATIISGSAVNYFGQPGGASTANNGIAAWFGPPNYGSTYNPRATGSAWYTVTAGDLANGAVTLRIMQCNSGASTKTVFATAVNPLWLCAKNLGPVDPH